MTYERLRAASTVAVGMVVDTSNDALMDFSPEDHSTSARRAHTEGNALLDFSIEERVRPVGAGPTAPSPRPPSRTLRNERPQGARSREQAAGMGWRDLRRAVVVFMWGVALGALVVMFLVIARMTMPTV